MSEDARIAKGQAQATKERRYLLPALSLVPVTLVAFLSIYFLRAQGDQEALLARSAILSRMSNLLSRPTFAPPAAGEKVAASWALSGTTVTSGGLHALGAASRISSNVISVRPGREYDYGLHLYQLPGGPTGSARVRLLWLDRGLNTISWHDSPALKVQHSPPDADDTIAAWHMGSQVAPESAAGLRFEVWNLGQDGILPRGMQVSQRGVYVEPHPNGARSSLAFSFDWESAMGGLVHSKGRATHDPDAATREGLAMRDGANWLLDLFAQYKIRASFYATGYNLLDGNQERLIFSGDPTYRWATKEYGWDSDYWLTHPWFSDDPFGTYRTDPGWYFGDQTRMLLTEGHEIAPHTFGHLYVRGSSPQELAVDLDQWIAVARAAGITETTTFAFPWRSSNSISAEFYDLLYSRGIRSVTRVYEETMKDLYALGTAPVSSGGVVTTYNKIAVMPDFLLGRPSGSAGVDEGGESLGLDAGLAVLDESMRRRGTTSFWTHPEQLASDPSLDGERAAWEGVVRRAAEARNAGRLWISSVSDIVAFQTAAQEVTAVLEKLPDGWRINVSNKSGRQLQGVTLTMPAEISSARSNLSLLTVALDENKATILSEVGEALFPTRQLVIPNLPVGDSAIDVEWVAGMEPLP